MALSTGTNTTALLPYGKSEYEWNFAEVTTDLIYKHCHASVAKRVQQAFDALELDEHENPPPNAAIAAVVKIIEKVAKAESIFQPTVSVFYGEAIATWKYGRREITVLSRGNDDDPKIMYYESRDNQPSYHRLKPNATDYDLSRAIGFSKGWLFHD